MAVHPQSNEQKSASAWWLPAITMFLKLSAWIAAPIISALFLGKWLDAKYGTEPWLFLASVGAAFFVSMTGLVINTLKEFKKIEKQNSKNSNGKTQISNQIQNPKSKI
ncbi:MAG: AtpZ/AtpI family protein [Planctomycetes bacterium]|jgi:hypothetical protein|nr:AtpZ/AtpI family protein [Planctomycetota bacterium]